MRTSDIIVIHACQLVRVGVHHTPQSMLTRNCTSLSLSCRKSQGTLPFQKEDEQLIEARGFHKPFGQNQHDGVQTSHMGYVLIIVMSGFFQTMLLAKFINHIIQTCVGFTMGFLCYTCILSARHSHPLPFYGIMSPPQ